jgi:probable HAF family extracellular repeat protein
LSRFIIRTSVAALAGAALTMAAVLPAAAAPSDRTPHDLGTLVPGGNSYAVSVNNFDQAVGNASTGPGYQFHAFLWSHGKMRDLGSLFPGGNSVATAINDRGQIVGWTATGTGSSAAFKYEHGTMTRLWYDGSRANAINNRGQVAGGNGNDAIIWDAQGNAKVLPTLSNCQYYTEAYSINDRGEAVGGCWTYANEWHSVEWDTQGDATDLGRIYSYSINNRGQVAAEDMVTHHAVLRTNGVNRDLGTLPGTETSSARGVNDFGVVAGGPAQGSYAGPAFRWANGSMTGLGGLAPNDSAVGSSINERGHIAGWSGQHAVLWK